MRLFGAAAAVRAGAVGYRALDDGRELVVYPMLPGQHRLAVGTQGDGGYDDAWCFHALADVLPSLEAWDGAGDPPGRWYRHIGSGRRRRHDADGNVIHEEVRR